MKFNSNVYLTAALVATLSTMVACAPAKSGTKFKDRTSANSGLPPVDRFFGKQDASAEDIKALNDKIILVVAVVEDSNGKMIGDIEVGDLRDERKKNGTSAIAKPTINEPSKDNEDADSDETPAAAARKSDRARNKHLITVRVVLSDIGAIDFMGLNYETGTRDSLIPLETVDTNCEKKFAQFSVRAACVDAACATLAVQVAEEGSEGEVQANMLLTRVGEINSGLVKKMSYKTETEVRAPVGADKVTSPVATSESSDESQVTVKSSEVQSANCKATLTDEEKAAEEKAKADADAKAKSDADAAAEEESARKKKTEEGEAVEVVATLGE